MSHAGACQEPRIVSMRHNMSFFVIYQGFVMRHNMAFFVIYQVLCYET